MKIYPWKIVFSTEIIWVEILNCEWKSFDQSKVYSWKVRRCNNLAERNIFGGESLFEQEEIHSNKDLFLRAETFVVEEDFVFVGKICSSTSFNSRKVFRFSNSRQQKLFGSEILFEWKFQTSEEFVRLEVCSWESFNCLKNLFEEKLYSRESFNRSKNLFEGSSFVRKFSLSRSLFVRKFQPFEEFVGGENLSQRKFVRVKNLFVGRIISTGKFSVDHTQKLFVDNKIIFEEFSSGPIIYSAWKLLPRFVHLGKLESLVAWKSTCAEVCSCPRRIILVTKTILTEWKIFCGKVSAEKKLREWKYILEKSLTGTKSFWKWNRNCSREYPIEKVWSKSEFICRKV